MVALLGFASGLPLALSFATLSAWLEESAVKRADIALFSLAGTAYALKFLWAPLMDRLRLPGLTGRLGLRRAQLTLLTLLLCGAIFYTGTVDPRSAPGLLALGAVAIAFCSATLDIVIDAFRIELLEDRQQSAGSAVVVYGYRVAMLVSGGGALFIADQAGWFAAYATMAAIEGLALILILLLVPEPKHRPRAALAGLGAESGSGPGADSASLGRKGLYAFAGALFLVAGLVWLNNHPGPAQGLALAGAVVLGVTLLCGAVPAIEAALVRLIPIGARRHIEGAVIAPFADFTQRRDWAVILAFVVLYKLGDALAGVMSNPFYISVGFDKSQIAAIAKGWGLAATLLGVGLGGWLVGQIGQWRALLVAGLLQMASNLVFSLQALAGADPLLLTATIFVENATGGIGTAVFVGYLSGLCNRDFTATHYALLSALSAVGRAVLGSASGRLATDFDWASFFALTSLGAIPGLLLLVWLMRRAPAGADGVSATVPAAR